MISLPSKFIGRRFGGTKVAESSFHSHNAHNLVEDICGRHSGQLRVSIVRGRDLDDIGTDEVHVLKAADDSPELSGGPAAGLGCSGGGRKRRVESVDVDGHVHGIRRADAVNDLLDDAVDADLVDGARFDDLEADVAVVFVVAGPRERRADPGVDVGVVAEESFLRRVVEVCAVVDGRDLGGRSAEDFRLPRVQVRVEVDYGYGTVDAVDGAQDGQDDRVVTTEGNLGKFRSELLRWVCKPVGGDLPLWEGSFP